MSLPEASSVYAKASVYSGADRRMEMVSAEPQQDYGQQESGNGTDGFVWDAHGKTYKHSGKGKGDTNLQKCVCQQKSGIIGNPMDEYKAQQKCCNNKLL